MSFLLDTQVVSDWTKPRPNAGVVQSLTQVDEDDVFLSVVTVAELRHGIERFPAGGRRVVERIDQIALERAGIENFRFHELRHTRASWHVQNGTPPFTLQKLGG